MSRLWVHWHDSDQSKNNAVHPFECNDTLSFLLLALCSASLLFEVMQRSRTLLFSMQQLPGNILSD
ncbi:unnamed protein product [Plutella xylostella]|uniref:(diamondback moth) hypothetical protein n=1 Tax=Plutella xylostella TaxID=51655 RepID=A0A8S4EWU2_PLUXY|nr:unnamed protein product [Plutella xylostella]